MSVLGVIPARGGSVGLPNKHLLLLGGEPLIVHTIRASLRSTRITRTIVSTDDDHIARVARSAGAEVPFRRPAELAGPETPTLAVIQHAVAWVEQHDGMTPTHVVTLQPTSPLRGAAEIDDAVEQVERSGADSAVSVTPIGHPTSILGTLRDGSFSWLGGMDGDLRRQAAAPTYRLTGAIYVTRRDLLADGKLIGDDARALVVDAESAIDIDTLDDLLAARRAVRRRRLTSS